ncbi:MAG: ABC transporter permease [Promethearchaeota archaeon]
MNLLKSKVNNEELEGITPISKISLPSSLVMIKKTIIFDLCTLPRLAISIFFMVLVPALVLVFTPSGNLSGEESIFQLLGIVTWYYNFSILFPIIIISATGPLISDELKTGTMLFLVSKPISRFKVILSKFIALYIYGIVISLLSLALISLIGLIKYPFSDIGLYFLIYFLYSLIIIFFFGGITMGFSSIFTRSRNVLLLPLTLVIFSFLVMMMFKPLLFFSEDNWYEKYMLYNLDIGFQFANVFLWIGEYFIPKILDYYDFFFWMFGIVKQGDDWDIYVKTEYYHPIFSLFYMLIIGVILLIIGILVLKKRDIS